MQCHIKVQYTQIDFITFSYRIVQQDRVRKRQTYLAIRSDCDGMVLWTSILHLIRNDCLVNDRFSVGVQAGQLQNLDCDSFFILTNNGAFQASSTIDVVLIRSDNAISIGENIYQTK